MTAQETLAKCSPNFLPEVGKKTDLISLIDQLLSTGSVHFDNVLGGEDLTMQGIQDRVNYITAKMQLKSILPQNRYTSEEIQFLGCLEFYDYVSTRRQKISKKPVARQKAVRETLSDGYSPELEVALELITHIPKNPAPGLLKGVEYPKTNLNGNSGSQPGIVIGYTPTEPGTDIYRETVVAYTQHALQTTIEILKGKNSAEDVADSLVTIVGQILKKATDPKTESGLAEDMVRLALNLVEGATTKKITQDSLAIAQAAIPNSAKPTLLSERILQNTSLLDTLNGLLAQRTSKPVKQLTQLVTEPLLAKVVLPILYNSNPALNPDWSSQVIAYLKDWEQRKGTDEVRQELAAQSGIAPEAVAEKALDEAVHSRQMSQLEGILGLRHNTFYQSNRAGRLLMVCVDLVSKKDQAADTAELIFNFMRQPFAVRSLLVTASPDKISKSIGDWLKALPSLLKDNPIETIFAFLSSKNSVGGKVVASALWPKLYATVLDEARPHLHLDALKAKEGGVSFARAYSLTGMLPEAARIWVNGDGALSGQLSDGANQERYRTFLQQIFSLNPVRLLKLDDGRALAIDNYWNLPLDLISPYPEKVTNRNMLRIGHSQVIEHMIETVQAMPHGSEKDACRLLLMGFLIDPAYRSAEFVEKEKWQRDDEMAQAEADTLIPWILDGLTDSISRPIFLDHLTVIAPYMSEPTKAVFVKKLTYYLQARSSDLTENGGLQETLFALGWYTQNRHPRFFEQDTPDKDFADNAVVPQMVELIQGWGTRRGVKGSDVDTVAQELAAMGNILTAGQRAIEAVRRTTGTNQTFAPLVTWLREFENHGITDINKDEIEAAGVEPFRIPQARAMSIGIVPQILAFIGATGSDPEGSISDAIIETVQKELMTKVLHLRTPLNAAALSTKAELNSLRTTINAKKVELEEEISRIPQEDWLEPIIKVLDTYIKDSDPKTLEAFSTTLLQQAKSGSNTAVPTPHTTDNSETAISPWSSFTEEGPLAALAKLISIPFVQTNYDVARPVTDLLRQAVFAPTSLSDGLSVLQDSLKLSLAIVTAKMHAAQAQLAVTAGINEDLAQQYVKFADLQSQLSAIEDSLAQIQAGTHTGLPSPTHIHTALAVLNLPRKKSGEVKKTPIATT